MARYGKIDKRMWGDARFLTLSKPPPCGQTLWVYLLTGPHTTSIPGLFVAGEAMLAEALGWPLKGFREAFQEVSSQGMVEADFSNRVLWIPKAVIYNPPESPNVVKSWRAYWDEIPECELKTKAYQHLKAFVEGMGKGFAEGYSLSCAPPGAHPSPNLKLKLKLKSGAPETEKDKPGEDDRFARFWKAYPRKAAKQEAAKAFASIDPPEDLVADILAAIDRQKKTHDWVKEHGRFIPYPASWLRAGQWEDQPPEILNGQHEPAPKYVPLPNASPLDFEAERARK